ncbi:hypothetical protein BP5796_00702 [Coleophoma crateriformis]|uniref:Uncharacterized protein n=1 Tax=Coleophoma crateriformis TaxID=565419 RepID=A0A3D8T8P5_9HELO|nr:hypothetical protein BP5796_00702 [Coleophoma crateriformis]
MAARKQLTEGATSAPQKQSAEFENPVTVDHETEADSNTDPILGPSASPSVRSSIFDHVEARELGIPKHGDSIPDTE